MQYFLVFASYLVKTKEAKCCWSDTRLVYLLMGFFQCFWKDILQQCSLFLHWQEPILRCKVFITHIIRVKALFFFISEQSFLFHFIFPYIFFPDYCYLFSVHTHRHLQTHAPTFSLKREHPCQGSSYCDRDLLRGTLLWNSTHTKTNRSDILYVCKNQLVWH